MNPDGMNDVTAPVDWSAAAKAEAKAVLSPGGLDPDYPIVAATRSSIAALGIVQLIPYTGRGFESKWKNWIEPVAWVLCANGLVLLMVNDLAGRHLVVIELSDETTDFWGVDSY
ncbi:hypothetical protein EB75_17750 [Mycobacterium sp. ST-F2]|nr:hypothetical protein EB75_17750 [Mycobacterium sp. ST-F2]